MKQRRKRSLSIILALSMAASMVSSTGISAAALNPAPADVADSDAQAQSAQSSSLYEPWKHGYRFVDILNWDPSTDRYADELQAHVPLQEHNEAFAATQANPNLTQDTKLYSISTGNYRSTDVAEAPWNGGMAYDDFSYNAFKFWQYTDFIGAGGRPTSGTDRGADSKEYGTMSIPIPAYVNAAHKNGAKALGEYFVPRNPQYTEEWLYKDENGNFPYAQKMIDIMNYYGFDGYFINQEENIDASYVPLFREMLKWMRDQGCYIQWYDSITDSGWISYQNNFNATNSNWIWNETNGRVTDSIFLNYWNNPGSMQSSAEHAKSLGLDPHEVVYYGVEGGQWQWSKDLDGLRDETGNSILSFAIWGSDFYREQFHKEDNNRYKSQYQWESEERERMYFTSPSENAGDYTSVNRPDVGVSNPNFKGFSRYIAERSVINGSAFTSNFNNGHGMQYFQGGEVSRDIEWTNVNIQDVLPTWQWWVESEGTKLDMDWDYGSTYERIVEGETLPFEYQQIGAYNGGSSLVAYGDLEGENLIHLYKTDLNIVEDSKISLTYNKPSTDASTMQLALVFKSAPDNVVYLPIENAGQATDGWKTVELDLSNYAGEELAAISVQVDSDTAIPDYQVNFGQIKVSDGMDYTPNAPRDFQIDKVFDETGEVEVSWTLDDYDQVKQYNIYAGYADGSERFVGGAYADNYYIANLEDRDNIVSLKLKAVGKDGSESEAAIANFNGGDIITNIQTVSENNKLNVTWDEAEGEYDSVTLTLNYYYSDKEPVSVTVDKGVKNAQLDIPLEDGSQYVLTLSTAAGDTDYFGKLADNYCEPYVGEMRFKSETSMNMTVPQSSDWKSLTLVFDDGTSNTFTRTGGVMRNISVPAGSKKATVTMTDRYGNQSTPTMFINGIMADLDGEITAEFVPDEVLRQAIIEQVGPTLGDMLDYKGALDVSGLSVADLTGLNMMTGLTSLNIANTQVSDLTPLAGLSSLKRLDASNIQMTTLTAGMLPESLSYIDMSDNTKLTTIEKDTFASLKSISELYLTNSPALENLYLNDANISYFNITGCTSLNTINADGATIGTLNITNNAYVEKLTLNNASVENLLLNGCTGLAELYAAGIDLNEIDFTGCTGLQVVELNDSTLEKISCDDPAALSEIVSIDLSGARLDLSEGTPEKAFVDAMAAATAGKDDIILEDSKESNLALKAAIVADQTTIEPGQAARVVDGDENGYIRLYVPATITIDLGSAQTITSWRLANDGTNYGLSDFTIKASNDGKEYTTIASVEGNSDVIVNGTIAEPAAYRYYQLECVKNYGSGGDIRELELNGHKQIIYPAGVKADGQRPAAYLQEMPEKVTVTTSQIAELRTKDYFEAMYNEAETVRGNLFSDLAEADWIAEDYDIAAQIAIPEKVYVEIKNEQGEIINQPEAPDTPSVDTTVNRALNANVLGGSGQNGNGEGYAQMFDGYDNTKWCTNGNSGWVAFSLEEAISVGKWITKHAQTVGEPSAYNTEDFELQVLNTEALGMSEDEFLASDQANNTSILGNDANWTTIDHVTGNTEKQVDRDLEDAPEARVYRLKINHSINGDQYAAVRLHELELYAADSTPRDYEGIMSLAETGLYTVEFKKGKNVLNTMEVRVKAVTSILETVIEKAEQMKADGALENTMEAVVTEFNAALEEAKALVAKEDATQAELKDSAVRLLAAMAKVDWKQGDKTILEVAVDVALSINENLDQYEEAGKQEFIDALANAQALLESGNAWQDDIDAATDALIEAMSNLRMKPNKDILNDMINQASGLDLSVYTEDSAAALNAALADAQTVAANENATQAEIDVAANTLQAALNGLVFVDGTTGTDNGSNGATAPAGDGSKPTKTGDAGAAGLAALAVLSAGALIVLKKRK